MPLGSIFAERVETGYLDLPLLAVTGERGVVPRDSLNRRDSSNEDKSAYLRVLPDDIAYNTMRMWQGVAGLSAYEGIVSPAYTVCRPLDGLVPKFAPHLLKHPANIRLFHRHSQGLVDDTLNLKFPHFAKLLVALPPVAEQKKIAAVLADVDAAIGAAQQFIEHSGSVRNKTVLAQLHALKAPRISFSKIVTAIEAGKSPLCEDRPATAGEVGVLKIGAVSPRGFDPEQNKVVADESLFSPEMLVQANDLLMTRANGSPELIGLSCVVGRISQRLYLSDKTFRVSLNAQKVDKHFVDICLRSQPLRAQIETASTGGSGSMSNLSQSAILSLQMQLPSLADQHRIVSLSQSFSAAMTAEEQKLATLERVKTELARRLLTGALRVKS